MSNYDNLDTFYTIIPDKNKKNIKETILFLCYYLHRNQKKKFYPRDVNELLININLKHTNIPKVFIDLKKEKKLIIDEDKSYFLHRNQIERIEKILNNQIPVPTNDYFNLSLVEKFKKSDYYYIYDIAEEMCLCYDNKCYTATLIIMRKLLEAFIILIFNSRNEEEKIKNNDGTYFYLKDLIKEYLNLNKANIGRNSKSILESLKSYGDTAVHKYNFKVYKKFIDDTKSNLDIIVQELISNIKHQIK